MQYDGDRSGEFRAQRGQRIDLFAPSDRKCHPGGNGSLAGRVNGVTVETCIVASGAASVGAAFPGRSRTRTRPERTTM